MKQVIEFPALRYLNIHQWKSGWKLLFSWQQSTPVFLNLGNLKYEDFNTQNSPANKNSGSWSPHSLKWLRLRNIDLPTFGRKKLGRIFSMNETEVRLLMSRLWRISTLDREQDHKQLYVLQPSSIQLLIWRRTSQAFLGLKYSFFLFI